jgi:hypothetical protein
MSLQHICILIMEMSHYKSVIMGLSLSAVLIFSVPLGYTAAQDASGQTENRDICVTGQRNSNDSGEKVTACFYHYGEHFLVCDALGDNLMAYAELAVVNGEVTSIAIDENGSHEGCGHENLDLPEGTQAKLRACAGWPEPDGWCGDWVYTIA